MLVSAADGTLDGEEYTRDARTCVGLKTGKNDAYLHGRGLHEPGRAPKHGAGRGSGFRASLGRATRPALTSLPARVQRTVNKRHAGDDLS